MAQFFKKTRFLFNGGTSVVLPKVFAIPFHNKLYLFDKQDKLYLTLRQPSFLFNWDSSVQSDLYPILNRSFDKQDKLTLEQPSHGAL